MRMKIHLHDKNIRKKGIEVITEKIQNGLLVEKRRLFNETVKKKSKAKPQRKFNKQEQDFIDSFRQALKEVELHRQGKMKLQSIEEFLKELRLEN
jgi:ABC-type phosphate transport system ATPase subunit